jgi:hypothetical protein
LIGTSIGNTNQRARSSCNNAWLRDECQALLTQALADPSLADQALPIFEPNPTLCDCAAFVHTIAMPIAAFLNIYSRLLVEWRKRVRCTLNTRCPTDIKTVLPVRPLAFSGFDLTCVLQSDDGKPVDISSIAWRI